MFLLILEAAVLFVANWWFKTDVLQCLWQWFVMPTLRIRMLNKVELFFMLLLVREVLGCEPFVDLSESVVDMLHMLRRNTIKWTVDQLFILGVGFGLHSWNEYMYHSPNR